MFQISQLPRAFYRKRCNVEGFKKEEWWGLEPQTSTVSRGGFTYFQ